MVRFSADCDGPGGAFRTSVWSARDGRLRMEQHFPNEPAFAAGVSLEGGWQRARSGGVDPLKAATESVMRGHEFALLALAPESRYASPRARPPEPFAGRTVDVVRFDDGSGGDVDLLYGTSDGLPIAMRSSGRAGRTGVLVEFGDWRGVGTVRVPHRFTITYGTDVFRYAVTSASTQWIEDSEFRPQAAERAAATSSPS
jgi:hypothetical protein